MTTADALTLEIRDALDTLEVAAVDPLTYLADLFGSSEDRRGYWKPTPVYHAFMDHAGGVADLIDRVRFLLDERERFAA